MQRNVLEYLENSVKSFPNKIAFADEEKEYTYLEFSNYAKLIANKICENVVEINKPIAVLVDRNVKSLIGFMAVLYSGNFYVPIDNKMPKQRIEKVLEQVKPVAILCTSEDIKLAEEIVSADKLDVAEEIASADKLDVAEEVENADKLDVVEGKMTAKIINVDEIINNKIDLTCNDKILEERRNKILDIDPVYIIFTSGSTGTPKGIVISHRSVIDFTDWMAKTFEFTNNDIMGNQAPFYFDLSVKDIYTTLKCGATTHIIPKKVLMFPMLLIDYLNTKKATALIWATSAFNLVSTSKVLEKKKLETVNKVILGGEALLAKHLNTWRNAMPQIKYVNLYGPTEVTVDCTYYIVDKEYSDEEAIPIGKACENKEVLLLDENLKEVKDGETGEICVRGTGVAKGYYNDFEKTQKVFIQNPLNPYYPDIIYRTGDIGMKNKDGLIVFQARKDGQIKHMGYRIELGEIERAVNSLETIESAVCIYNDKTQKIFCVYTGTATDAEIIKHIQNIIPKYMYPNIFKKLDNMPYNANGKIDRVKIKNSI